MRIARITKGRRRHGGAKACGAARGGGVCLQRVAKLAVVEPPVAVLVKLQELGPHVGRAGGPLPLAQLTHHRVELVEIEQAVAVRVVPLQQVRRMRGRAVEGQRFERIPQLAVVKPAAAVVVVPHKGVTNIGGNPMGHRVRQSMRSLASRAQRSNGTMHARSVDLFKQIEGRTCTERQQPVMLRTGNSVRWE